MNIVHLDIKPQNATIGLQNETSDIHLIDFGISEYYIDTDTGIHI